MMAHGTLPVDDQVPAHPSLGVDIFHGLLGRNTGIDANCVVVVGNSRARVLSNQEAGGWKMLAIAFGRIHEPVMGALSHVKCICRGRITDTATAGISHAALTDALTVHAAHENILI
jgi:hypothetical protein